MTLSSLPGRESFLIRENTPEIFSISPFASARVPKSRRSALCFHLNSHKLSLECFVEDRWQQGVEFGPGIGLQLFQGVNFGLQVVKPNLLFDRRNWYLNRF